MSLSPWLEGGTFQVGVLYLAFRNKKGQSALVTAAVSQVLLTQDYQYAKVAYLGGSDRNVVRLSLSFKVFFFFFKFLIYFFSTVNQNHEMKSKFPSYILLY